jgi:hypothetical protein
MLHSRLCVLVVLGSSPVGQAQAPKDPQSALEPRSGPGAGQKFLEKMVGDWDVAKSFYPRSGGAPFRVTGTCRQTMIHGGRFLQSDFVFDAKEGRTTGMGLVGFESGSGKFTSVWTDARATRMSFRQSQDPFKGDEIVLFSQGLSDDVKSARRSRTVTRLEENGKRLVHRQFSLEADGSERLVMELLLTRREAK